MGPPWQLRGKESACQFRRCGFDPWVGKIPWRRKWQPTPVFLPGESPGQRSLAAYSPQGSQKSQTRLSHWTTNCGYANTSNDQDPKLLINQKLFSTSHLPHLCLIVPPNVFFNTAAICILWLLDLYIQSVNYLTKGSCLSLPCASSVVCHSLI